MKRALFDPEMNNDIAHTTEAAFIRFIPTATILLIMGLGGCSPAGPSNEQINNALQSQLPAFLEVKSLRSEFVPTGKNEGVVRIRAEIALTEDLFERARRPVVAQREKNDDGALSEAIWEAQREKVQLPEQSESAYKQADETFTAAVREAETPVLKLAHKAGENFPFAAKANAAKEFDEWKIATFEGDRPQIAGAARNAFPASALTEGDPTINEQEASVQKAAQTRRQAQQKLIADISSAIQANRAAIAAQLQAKEEATMAPVRKALQVGNSWTDYSSHEGMKVPLKWTISDCQLTGTSEDNKIGTIRFKVQSENVTGHFSGDVRRNQNSGAIIMFLKSEEKPIYPEGVPRIIPFIFSPQNTAHMLLNNGVLTKDGWGWTFTARQDGLENP